MRVNGGWRVGIGRRVSLGSRVLTAKPRQGLPGSSGCCQCITFGGSLVSLVVEMMWGYELIPEKTSLHGNTGWARDRIPVVARFSTLVQTGPAAHPASCTMGTRPLSLG